MTIRLIITILFVLAASACSHAPTGSNQSEMAELQEQLRATVEQKLATRPGFKEVTEFKIIKAEEAKDSAKFTYRVAYLSQTEQSGLVSDSMEAEITLVKTGDRNWKVTAFKPQAQTVVFQEAVEIIGRKKK